MSGAVTNTWFTDTLRLARALPADVAPGILADRYRERLGWARPSDHGASWIVFDGPSAVGKDTQISLVTEWLSDHGLTVRTVGGTGGGTALGPLVRALIIRNATLAGASRWLADYRIKAAAWTTLRGYAPVLRDADIVISNRGPLSQLVYSAVAGSRDLLTDRRAVATANDAIRSSDLHLLLSCPDDVVVRRAQARAASGEKRARNVDTPEFVAAANRAYHDLAAGLPWVRAVDVSRTREENLASVKRLIEDALDLGTGNRELLGRDGNVA
jgi:thymidylate kinase